MNTDAAVAAISDTLQRENILKTIFEKEKKWK
jgi:hypothetical protein